MVEVKISSSRTSFSVDVPADATILDVKKAVHAKVRKLYPTRQKLSVLGSKQKITDETKITEIFGTGYKGGEELRLKDLGPQISWKTVFVVEYLGPLLIHPLFYYFPQVFYGKEVQHSALQNYVYTFVMLHFAKRELETLFVHRFSHATMPWFNIVKNSAHYHILSGLFLAFDVYRPKFSATSPYIVNTIRDNENFLYIGAGAWAFFELSNLHTHLTTRALRPEGSTKRSVPYGYGFNLVSFPNYLFEILGWVVICVMTNSVAAWLFLAVGGLQMIVWAVKKHANYKKEFGKEYPRSRKAIIPFIL